MCWLLPPTPPFPPLPLTPPPPLPPPRLTAPSSLSDMKSTDADMGSMSFSVDELEPSTAIGNATKLSSDVTGAELPPPATTDADADLNWRPVVVVPAILAAIATAID